MNIFDKRPLALILTVFLSGFVAFSVCNRTGRIIALSVAGAILVLSLIFLTLSLPHRRLLLVCALILFLSFLSSYLYFDTYFYDISNNTSTVEINARVEDVEAKNNMQSVKLKVLTVNGEDAGGVKLYSYMSQEEAMGLSEGCIVNIVCTVDAFESTESFDTVAYYTSLGYSACTDKIISVDVIKFDKLPLDYQFKLYRKALSRRIIINSDGESGGLLCALLLGERNYLSGECINDFRRTGLTHVLALSGMHLALLSFALTKVLSALGMNKRLRKVFEIFFTVIYMALTGFPISVVRAGIMLIISSLLFLLARRSDAITTLTLSVFIICLIQPYSIFDISLWLSAFATLGIIILTELNNKAVRKEGLIKRVTRNAIYSVLASVFALGATVLISTVAFGTISILSPISTPIITILTNVYMYIGCALAVFGGALPLGYIVRPFGSLIIDIVSAISSINGIYTSAEFIVVEIAVIIFTILSVAFLVLKINKRRRALIILSILLFAVLVSSYSATQFVKHTDSIDYIYDGENERIVIKSGGDTMLIDPSYHSKSSAYSSVSLLCGVHVMELDSYVYTNYTPRLTASIERLISSIYVKDIYVPEPKSNEENIIAKEIAELLSGSKSRLIFYDEETLIYFGDYVLYPAFRSEDNKLGFVIVNGYEAYTYLSSGMLEGDTKTVAAKLIEGAHTLILGRHGKPYNNFKFTYEIKGISRFIISSENFLIPTEVMDYYLDIEVLPSPKRVNLIR